MATVGGILPTYQRFVNGAHVSSFSRRSFRPREKYLILLVFVTFALVCYGAFFYLPEYRSSNVNSAPSNSVYNKVYQSMRKAGPELLIPAPPQNQGLFLHDRPRNIDPHSEKDKAKLLAKIQEDEELDRLKNPKVLERPEVLGNGVAGPAPAPAPAPSSPARERDPAPHPHPDLLPPPPPPPSQPALPQLQSQPAQEKRRRVVTVPPAECGQQARGGPSCPALSGGEDPDPAVRQKRDKVKEMMKHAWDNYVLYAWGKNELRPLTKRGHTGSIFGSAGLGATIVDGLDTLYMMGLYDEFQQGRNWIEDNLDITNISLDISVFETNIRFVGGLLTCYSLTGDVMFRDKADHIAEKLLPAFQTPTGIPHSLINPKTGMSKNYGWASGGLSILSEFGTLHLEFAYLSDVTGKSIYRDKIDQIRDFLNSISKPRGLYPNYLNPKTGKWGQHHMTMGALGDSFYEYLLKAWIQSGKKDAEARRLYDNAMQAVLTHMLKVSRGGLSYFCELKFERVEHKMDHLGCFAGGLLALGADTLQNEFTERYKDVAAKITHTCHESYDRTAVKLGPEAFRFSEAMEAKAMRSSEKYYILRPEVIESYFVMWRLTNDQKYRDWGWEAVMAFEKHCRVPGGYTGIKNVYQEEPAKDDVQQSFFLAETLKYLYLMFSDNSYYSLDDWVLNTEAHPLPIKGVNPYYRSKEREID